MWGCAISILQSERRKKIICKGKQERNIHTYACKHAPLNQDIAKKKHSISKFGPSCHEMKVKFWYEKDVYHLKKIILCVYGVPLVSHSRKYIIFAAAEREDLCSVRSLIL